MVGVKEARVEVCVAGDTMIGYSAAPPHITSY